MSNSLMEPGEIRVMHNMNVQLDAALRKIQQLEEKLHHERTQREAMLHSFEQDGQAFVRHVEQISRAAASKAAPPRPDDTPMQPLTTPPTMPLPPPGTLPVTGGAPKVDVPKPFTGKQGDIDIDT